jgi:hypothetical protein
MVRLNLGPKGPFLFVPFVPVSFHFLLTSPTIRPIFRATTLAPRSRKRTSDLLWPITGPSIADLPMTFDVVAAQAPRLRDGNVVYCFLTMNLTEA